MTTFSSIPKRRGARLAALLAAGVALAVPTATVAGALLTTSSASASETLSQTFTFNDTTQYFTVPAGVTSLNVLADGGDGGGSDTLSAGGDGAEVTGSVSVDPGDTIVVEVGGAGSAGNFEDGSGTAGGAGGLSSGDGMNGGAGGSVYFGIDGAPAGGGGGGTEVVDATTGTVLAVAAGGGGAGGGGAYSGSGGGGGSSMVGDAVSPGGQGTSNYGAGGAGGPGGVSQGPAGEDGGTPDHGELSGGGGGGGGGYYNPGQGDFGGGDAGAGGGWSAYEAGGGGGGAGTSYAPPLGVVGENTTSTDGQVVLSWSPASAATVTSLGFNQDSVTAGQSYTVTATVQGLNAAPPTGNVEFSENGFVVGIAPLDGASPDTVSITATAPSSAGTVSWQAYFEGDSGAADAPGDSPSASATTLQTVVAAPKPKLSSVTAVSPSSGPTTGGTSVTITGTRFTGATKVLFGAVAATSFTVVSSTEIIAVSPPQAAGVHGIYVTTTAGTSAAVKADQFTYTAVPPSVTSISPTSGSTSGGTTVTITGRGFTGATKVVFGGVAATSFSVVSDTEITAVSPAQAAAVHGIYVTTAGGTSAAVKADRYTYVVSVPTVTAVSPSSGPTSGGTTVTITGTGFTGATKVLFGAVAATSFTVVSSTEITAVSPAEAAGVHNIYVTTPAGTSAAVMADLFTYVV